MVLCYQRRLKINPQVLAQRIKEIEFQFLKTHDMAGISNAQKADIAVSALIGIFKSAPDGIIIDAEFPTSFFGCTLDWTYGDVSNDKKVKITAGSEIIEHNLGFDYIRTSEQEEYNIATNMAISLNGNVTVPDVGYTTVNLTTTILDATNLALDIN